MYGSKSKPKGTAKKTKSPIRVVVRCAWSGARLTVPTTSNNDDALPPIRASTTTLLDLVLRLESALPPALFQNDSAATLVCLRNTVPQSEWESTKLKQVLEGDDGAAGVVLTLDLGAAGNSANSAPATNAKKSNPVKSAISSAASSLNIKPVVMSSGNVAPAPAPAAALPAASTNNNYPEPMDISNDNTPAAPIHKVMMPEQAWDIILQSNFDATTKDCLNTLLKIIDNILSKPNEPKVRSIRCANAAFEKKVGCCTGGYDFLYSIGFLPKYPAVLGMQSSVASSATPEMLELTPENESKEMLLRGRKVLAQSAVANLGIDEKELPPLPKIPEAIPASSLLAPPSSGSSNSRGQVSGGFNVYKTHSHNIQSAAVGAPDPYKDGSVSKTERQLNQLQSKKSKLEKEMQAQIENDRGLIAYRAGNGPTAFAASTSTAQSGAGGGGGKGDSSLVAARMKRMDEERKKREEGGFTTKAMRDLERMKKAKVYSHAQIRVNFSDGTQLHAKFLPREKVSSIRSVIRSAFQPSLAQSLDFDLYVAPPRRLLNDTNTLDQEELVPAAKIHVSWKVGASPTGGAPGGYLRAELFSGGSHASAFPDAKPIVKEANTQSNLKRKDSTNDNGNGGGQSKEDLLMARMMGKKTGLLGMKGADKDGKKSGGGGKPKWFKG